MFPLPSHLPPHSRPLIKSDRKENTSGHRHHLPFSHGCPTVSPSPHTASDSYTWGDWLSAFSPLSFQLARNHLGVRPALPRLRRGPFAAAGGFGLAPRPTITRAHLGLDDAREEAQGDQQLHCGRRPLPCASPPGPPAHADLSPTASGQAPPGGRTQLALATTPEDGSQRRRGSRVRGPRAWLEAGSTPPGSRQLRVRTERRAPPLHPLGGPLPASLSSATPPDARPCGSCGPVPPRRRLRQEGGAGTEQPGN